MRSHFAGLFALSILVSVPAYADRTLVYVCDVSEVVDGDTVVVSNKTHRGVVRDPSKAVLNLDAVDAPELDQPGGLEARDVLNGLLAGKKVLVVEHLDGSRSSGAWLFVGEERRSINLLLVEKGLAWKTEPKVRSALSVGTLQGIVKNAHAQMEPKEISAKEAKVGIWAAHNPTPPWEWIKEHPSKTKQQLEP